MATIYLDRVVTSCSNGTFTFEDGDLQSATFEVADGASPVQGMTTDHSTSGFIVPNRTVRVSLSVFLRKGQAFQDYLKQNYSLPISIQGMASNTGSGMELELQTRYTAINVISQSESYNFTGVSSPGVQTFTFLAQDYLTE